MILKQAANLIYTASQTEEILGKTRMTLSRYVKAGLLQKEGYNAYLKSSVDRLRQMSRADIAQYLKAAEKERPELAQALRKEEYAVVVKLSTDTDSVDNPIRTLLHYAVRRNRTREYPRLFLLDTAFMSTRLGSHLYEAIREVAPPTMRVEVLPYPEYTLAVPPGMQESCIRVFSEKEFKEWRLACEQAYIPPEREPLFGMDKEVPPLLPARLEAIPNASPLPEAFSGSTISLLSDGRQAIFRDDRLFNLHAHKDLEGDSTSNRLGLNRLHYQPDMEDYEPTFPRLHDPGSVLAHLNSAHAIAVNRQKLTSDLLDLLEDQLDEEQEVIQLFIATMNRYMYRLVRLMQTEGKFPRDSEGFMILPDRAAEYEECLPPSLRRPYHTEGRVYPPAYLTTFGSLTEILRTTAQEHEGVPRTYRQKVEILDEVRNINQFLR